MEEETKENIVTIIILAVSIVVIPIIFYLLIGLIDWLLGDPLKLINNL